MIRKVKWSGTLLDTIGGKPVSGVEITLSACEAFDGRNQCADFTVGKCTTDDSGHFLIKEKAARSNRYAVFISGAKGQFEQFKYQFEISESELNKKYSTIYLNYSQ